jgi:hypothetical protein
MSPDDELSAELSEPVRGAVAGAVRIVESLVDELTASEHEARKEQP